MKKEKPNLKRNFTLGCLNKKYSPSMDNNFKLPKILLQFSIDHPYQKPRDNSPRVLTKKLNKIHLYSQSNKIPDIGILKEYLSNSPRKLIGKQKQFINRTNNFLADVRIKNKKAKTSHRNYDYCRNSEKPQVYIPKLMLDMQDSSSFSIKTNEVQQLKKHPSFPLISKTSLAKKKIKEEIRKLINKRKNEDDKVNIMKGKFIIGKHIINLSKKTEQENQSTDAKNSQLKIENKKNSPAKKLLSTIIKKKREINLYKILNEKITNPTSFIKAIKTEDWKPGPWDNIEICEIISHSSDNSKNHNNST